MSGSVVVRIEGSVATLTLDDFQTRNALGASSVEALLTGLREAEKSSEVRAIVLSGAHNVFSSGANRNDRRSGSARGGAGGRVNVFDIVAGCRKPTIAAVSGAAVGGGANLALACDLRVCAEDAWLQWPQVGMGIMPGSGTLARLSHIVGSARALEWTMTGRRISAAEGHAAGLHVQVVPAADLVGSAADLADVIAAAPPTSVRFVRECVASLVERDVLSTRQGDEYRSRILYSIRASEDGTRSSERATQGNGEGCA